VDIWQDFAPAPTSTETVRHFVECKERGVFCSRLPRGKPESERIIYDLANVRVPVSIW